MPREIRVYSKEERQKGPEKVARENNEKEWRVRGASRSDKRE